MSQKKKKTVSVLPTSSECGFLEILSLLYPLLPRPPHPHPPSDVTGLARFQTALGQKPQVTASEAEGWKGLEGVAAEGLFEPCRRPLPHHLRGLSTPSNTRIPRPRCPRGPGEEVMSSLHQERRPRRHLKPLRWFLTLPRTVRSDPSGIRPGDLRSAQTLA